MLRSLAYLLLAVLVITALVFAAGWWIVHRTLPQLDGAVSLPELRQEVTVDRDTWGVPHLRAGSLEDLLTAQGYVVAQDRLWQMDILRRVAAGQLSEVFGPIGLERDRELRTLGLNVAAEREATRLDPQMRAILEAYARGVNRFIEEHRGRLPWEFVAMGYQPRPWRPADSLLISGYMYFTLTSTWKAELKRSIVSGLVDTERAADLYVVDSPLDHVIVGGESPAAKGPAPQQRARRKKVGAGLGPPAGAPAPLGMRPDSGAWKAAEALLDEFDEGVRSGLGSNNWVVDGTHTASGKPLLANDTHLQLGMPCIWYIIHLTAPGWNVEGFTLPGAPLVVIGHNDRIAWGFTNNGADVQDLYIESFSRSKPRQYLVNGNYVDAEVRTERIHVKGAQDEIFDVIVTRHGPIVQRAGDQAYALKWTATEPGGLSGAYSIVGSAQNWNEFRQALRQVPGPAQNAVYADVDGNIGFIVAARIPVRKKGDGSVPVTGDTDEYEWTGYIPFDELPQALNPPGGVMATANARVVGPGYPHYLTDRWASPYRTARIYELLAAKKDFRPGDFLAIQTDIVSPPHKFLAEQLVQATHAVRPRDDRTKALLSRLAGWDGRARAESIETSYLEYTRRMLLRNLLRPYLGAETPLYEWREAVFLEKVLRERPARWLPANFHSYDELLMASADEAVDALRKGTGTPDASKWRWGRQNALRILHPLGRSGWRERLLSIGPLEQSGTMYSVKAMQVSHGPAMRFVADLSSFDNSLMELTLGESGQYGSPNYRDQFAVWFEGRSIARPFSDAAQEKSRVHRLRLFPASGR